MGGTQEDYENFVNTDVSFDFENKGVVKQDAIQVGALGKAFNQEMYYKGSDVKLKINNYVPPIKEQNDPTMLALDTWNRETQLPPFYWNFFVKTFMLPAYTCDKLTQPEFQYPGLKETYSCYCNNGDYHTMPDLNFEIRKKDF